jgi:hypothetical protein
MFYTETSKPTGRSEAVKGKSLSDLRRRRSLDSGAAHAYLKPKTLFLACPLAKQIVCLYTRYQ